MTHETYYSNSNVPFNKHKFIWMSTLDILLSKIIAHWKRDWYYMNFVGKTENYCYTNMFSLISYSLILTYSNFACNSADLIFFFFYLQSGNGQWKVAPTLKFMYSIPVTQLVHNTFSKTKRKMPTQKREYIQYVNTYFLMCYVDFFFLNGRAMGFHCLFK